MKNTRIRNGLLVFTCTLALASCGNNENPASSGTARVTGTLTVPSGAVHNKFRVYVDTDTNCLNGCVVTCSGDCMGNTQAPYALSGVPSGLYYVYAVSRVNSIEGMPLVAGDLIGFYGGTGVLPPAGANASIPTSGTRTLDITLVVIP